ncbi:aminophospholipid-transporting P-type ATPase [Pelomyxa schiedti]|nr:aminophospholipid-transporting P-type ATPase [Pelomyxa schiedti]
MMKRGTAAATEMKRRGGGSHDDEEDTLLPGEFDMSVQADRSNRAKCWRTVKRWWLKLSLFTTTDYWLQRPFARKIASRFEPKYLPRTLPIPTPMVEQKKYPPNIVRNQRYTLLTFLPLTLFGQFKYFYNMYFLGIALTQFVPILKVGYLFTYWLPLIFVLALAIAKDAFDDIKRWKQDKRANSQQFQRVGGDGRILHVSSSDIKCGDFILVETNQRVPADMVFLWSSEKSGTAFIRTDQLDGETDWKLRRPLTRTQKLPKNDVSSIAASIYVEEPKKDIYSFVGKVTYTDPSHAHEEEPVTVDNVMWANTVLATGQVIGLVIYTGRETRTALNRNQPRAKAGQTEMDINFLSKVLFALLAGLSFLMVAVTGFSGLWFVMIVRFMILFSSIIPISMRVNLDMAKLLYALLIMWDKKIPGTIVRNSTIPEELGRINFLLSDKTGTLTKNDMIFMRLHAGSMAYTAKDMDDIQQRIQESLDGSVQVAEHTATSVVKRSQSSTYQLLECIRAIALCHNVTPVLDEDTGVTNYQAASPDEVALVKFTEQAGIALTSRDLTEMVLTTPTKEKERYEILQTFPFSSATKRMGIIVRDHRGVITFLMKGADVVMAKIINKENSEWVLEETENMARDGLRTLVFGRKHLHPEEYDEFAHRLHEAKCSMESRDSNVQRVIESLEINLDTLCVTGVEDKLQDDVRPTLEKLQAGGIKIWMLTGDKIETATCIAVSARLFKRDHNITTIAAKTEAECLSLLESFEEDSCLVIDGTSLQWCLTSFTRQFMWVATHAPAVVCCRCSPTQKAQIVTLIKQYTHAITCAIGDGGNDVSMITAADVGIGIEGKEGKQASLAADFSLTQFSHVLPLLLWHGRNSYKRSAMLAQFIMHRGLIISFIQAVFSSLFLFAAIAIYQGWLLVGYSTIYTMIPVFSLVLDEDVPPTVALTFVELYHILQKGRILSLKTFTEWLLISLFQGGMIMIVSMLLFESNFLNISGITFTVLILTELLNIAFEIRTWNLLIVIGELLTLVVYIGSIFVLPNYFDIGFILTWSYWWKVMVVTAFTCLPVSLSKLIYRRCRPTLDTKLVSRRGPKMNLLFAEPLSPQISLPTLL